MAIWNGQFLPVDINSQTVSPAQHELHVAESDGIEFKNHDQDDYFIQVFLPNGTSHPIVGLFVPGKDSGFLIVDGTKGDRCTYKILDPRNRSEKKAAGATHIIVITSGSLEKDYQTKRQ